LEIKVTGLREIEAQLASLGSKQGTKILRASMLAASRPILQQAQSNVASIQGGSGALHKSLGMRFYAGQQNVGEDGVPAMGGRFSVQVAPITRNRVAVALHNLIYGRKRKGIFYGHLIEFGHRIVTRGQKIVKGSVPPRPFLKPALDSKGAIAVGRLADEIRTRIAKHLAKNRK
jgi:hypothetical protein